MQEHASRVMVRLYTAFITTNQRVCNCLITKIGHLTKFPKLKFYRVLQQKMQSIQKNLNKFFSIQF